MSAKRRPLDEECPRCKAGPKERCRSPKGKVTTPHAARRDPAARNAGTAGRELKLTPELSRGITDALRLGVPVRTAAAAAGIGEQTFYRWLALGEAADPDDEADPFRPFREAVIQARAQGESRMVGLINQVAQRHVKSRTPVEGSNGQVLTDAAGNIVYKEVYEQDWRAAAFILERSFAGHWSRREVLELTDGDGLLPTAPRGGAGGIGVDQAGVDRVLANLAEFKARKEIETGRAEIVDAEVVDDA